jgi:hypothetical protein
MCAYAWQWHFIVMHTSVMLYDTAMQGLMYVVEPFVHAASFPHADLLSERTYHRRLGIRALQCSCIEAMHAR